ncbi:MAG: vWA domain-containing protein [Bacteriovoracaceae bacterium]
MRKRREIQLFSISFLDLLSGALGAVIILYIAVPKSTQKVDTTVEQAKTRHIEEQETKLSENQKIIKELQDANRKLREDIEKAQITKVETQVNSSNNPEQPFDVGFKFKGSRIVFVIDTSYSMYQEDRIGQVKAGLKMLITSMAPKFQIDVVQFPNGERTPFKVLWGGLKDLSTLNKYDVYDFVYGMRPLGGTPTRDVLLHVLNNYQDITDIVLLTDGAPSLHNSSRRDDIYDILKVVRENNPHEVQISTIGVGKDFIKDKTSDYYKFLQLLASENKGFFVGF